MSDKYRDDYEYGYSRGFDDGRNSVLKSMKPNYNYSSRDKDVIYANDKKNKNLSEVSRAIIVLFKMLTWLLTVVACIGLIVGLVMALLWFNQAYQNPSNKVWGWTGYAGLVLVIGSLVGLAAALFHLIEFFVVLFNKKGWFEKKNLPVILGIISVVLWFCVSATILYVSFGAFENFQVPGFNFAEINNHLPYIDFLRNINLIPSNRTVYLAVSIAVVLVSGLIGIWCLKSIGDAVDEKE